MIVEKNVTLPKKTFDRKGIKQTTRTLKDFINGDADNICIQFDSNEELNREYGCMRRYHVYHKLQVVNFTLDQKSNKLYITRRNPKDKATLDINPTISGIVFCHGKDDYGLWEGFYLTEEEKNAIWDILRKHDTEGCSVRGTRKEIAREMME